MPKFTTIDLTGKKFGRLTAVRFVPDDGKYARWLFACSCGNEVITLSQSVRSGNTKSCGCHKVDVLASRGTHKQSGKKRSGAYSSWAQMMVRCEWGGHPSFEKYGAAGIRVCERWRDFSRFFEDMGPRPSGCSIDRIDGSKGYEPSNCRWATDVTQNNNTRRTVRLLYGGETITLFDLCNRLGLSRDAIRSRANRRGRDFVAAFASVGVYVERRCA